MQQFLDSADSDKVKIAVDHREDPIFDDFFRGHGADVDRRTLEVGDFLCSARVVIERKTRADFEQSIIDGRLFTQLQHLTSNYPCVVILVEGTEDNGRLNRKALLGAYSAVMADFGASLIFTDDVEKSAEIIFSVAKHEQIARKQPMRIFAKRKALTAAQSQRAIVETLPMVGPKLAKKLLEHFGSIERIFTADENELLEVEKVGKKKAKLMRAIISGDYHPDEDHM